MSIMKSPFTWDAQAWTAASGTQIPEDLIKLLHSELRTITEHWCEAYKDRLDLMDRLGNALHREQHCLAEIERLKKEKNHG